MKLLYFITDDHATKSHTAQAKVACENGADFVQLRSKSLTKQGLSKVAQEIRKITAQLKVKFIVNDCPELAKNSEADGVHLGKADLSLLEAKAILHPNQTIGYTINSLKDFLDTSDTELKHINYIGLGPLRTTNTKKFHATPLGFSGIDSLSKEISARKKLPIFAIGGIEISDLNTLKNYQLSGVAVSSSINSARNPDLACRMYKSELSNFNSTI